VNDAPQQKSRFNLSALAVRERSVTLFFIIVISIAGIVAFLNLGRAEDPSFTIKAMTIVTSWPGATAQEMQDQVAEPLEKRLQELRWYDRTGASGGDILRRRLCRQRVIRGIDAHQRLPAMDDLAGVDQSSHDLAADAESEVALHARANDAGILARGAVNGSSRGDPHERRTCARVRIRSPAAREDCGHSNSSG
jgi:hypothetical protein